MSMRRASAYKVINGVHTVCSSISAKSVGVTARENCESWKSGSTGSRTFPDVAEAAAGQPHILVGQARTIPFVACARGGWMAARQWFFRRLAELRVKAGSPSVRQLAAITLAAPED